jgi:hypothetical protein
MTSLTILMPVYNESATVLAAIEDALTAELPVERRELIVVDDGSTDGTRELLRSTELAPNVNLVEHDRNRGKGAALRTGLQHATGDYTATPTSSTTPPTWRRCSAPCWPATRRSCSAPGCGRPTPPTASGT